MSQLDDFKNQIKSDGEFILDQSQSRLSPISSVVQPWSNLDIDQTNKLVSTFYLYLQLLIRNLNVLDQLPAGVPDNFRNTLSSIRAELNNYLSVGDDSITTQHHGALGQINNFVSTVHNYGLTSLLREQGVVTEKLHSAVAFADHILKNEAKVREADAIAESLIESHQAVRDIEIENLAERFNQLSSSKGYGSRLYYLFLIVGISILVCVAYKTYNYHSWNQYISSMTYVQYLINKTITFVLPIVLAVFSINQFLHFRKLKEFYEDKDSALKTMRGLLLAFPDLKPQITEVAAQKIFAEFKEKGESKMSESTLLKLLEIAKK